MKRSPIRALMVLCALGLAAACTTSSKSGGTGVGSGGGAGSSSGDIVLGSTMGLTGPVAAVSAEARDGAQAYFDKINDAGGINGRKIKFTVYDDGFQTANAVTNTRRLVTQDHALAMFFIFSTPATIAVEPYLDQHNILDFGPQAPVRSLITPTRPNVFMVSTSWYDQGRALGGYAANTLKTTKMGIFYDNDDVGTDGLAGVVAALKGTSVKLVKQAFPPSATNFTGQVVAMRNAGVDTVVIFGVNSVLEGLVKEIAQQHWSPKVLALSTASDPGLAKILGTTGYGMYSVSPYKLATSSDSAVQEYRDTLKKYFPKEAPSTFSLQGYTEAALMVKGLQNAGKDISRSSLINALNKFKDVDTGLASPITWNAHDHAGVQTLYLIQNQQGTLTQIGTIKAGS